jgi:hypothetical protein
VLGRGVPVEHLMPDGRLERTAPRRAPGGCLTAAWSGTAESVRQLAREQVHQQAVLPTAVGAALYCRSTLDRPEADLGVAAIAAVFAAAGSM